MEQRRATNQTAIRRWAVTASVTVLALIAALAAMPIAATAQDPVDDEENQIEEVLVETELGPEGEPDVSASFPDWQEIESFDAALTARGIATDPASGIIVVSDREHGELEVREASGGVVGVIPTAAEPQGLHYANGELYMASEDGNVITVFEASTFSVKRQWGTPGAGNGQFNEPCDVFVTSAGEVFVADALNDRVQVFDVNGGYLRQFGTTGSGNGQLNLDCSGASLVVAGGEVYITDQSNDRVQVFDLDGNYQRQWGSSGFANGQFGIPGGIAYADGHIYVADYSQQRVQVFDTGGQFQGFVSVPSPRDLWVDPSGTVMRVTESSPGVVHTFTTLRCAGQVPDFVGSSYGEAFDGTAGDDVVHLGAGDDAFAGSDGDDRICAGAGDDEIFGGSGKDFLWGDDGNDYIAGGDDQDRIWAGAGADEVHGGLGSDRMRGGDGHDVLWGQSGADRMYGDDGDDTLFGLGGRDRMYGGPGNDLLQGNHSSDRMYGGDGEDVMRGAKGKDEMYGEAGNDMMYGGDNTDVLRGGAGNDLMDGQRGSDSCPDSAGVNTRISC